MPDRACRDCGEPADFAILDEAGTMHGWLCERCERKHRRRRLGPWRRFRRHVKTLLGR